MHGLGVDIGGSGVRVALVDTTTGALIGQPAMHDHTLETPAETILATLVEAIGQFPESLPVGVGFPGVVEQTVVNTAPNLRSTWPGTDLAEALQRPSLVALNDADAAAVAEHRLGASRGENGTVLTITVGTGLGTALHRNHVLVPNLEFGLMPHPTLGGMIEDHASGRAKTIEGLSLVQWASRFQEVLSLYEVWLCPDLIVIGGGITGQWEALAPLLSTRAELRRAKFGPHAGLIGAALMGTSKVGDA